MVLDLTPRSTIGFNMEFSRGSVYLLNRRDGLQVEFRSHYLTKYTIMSDDKNISGTFMYLSGGRVV